MSKGRTISYCLFVCLYVPLKNFSLIWRSHHNGWRATNFDLKSALMAIEQWARHTYCDTVHPFIMVVSEDPWVSHLLPSIWQRGCHYLFLRLISVAAEIRTFNLLHARQRSNRLRHCGGIFIIRYCLVWSHCWPFGLTCEEIWWGLFDLIKY